VFVYLVSQVNYVYDIFTELVTSVNTSISVNTFACRKWSVK